MNGPVPTSFSLVTLVTTLVNDLEGGASEPEWISCSVGVQVWVDTPRFDRRMVRGSSSARFEWLGSLPRLCAGRAKSCDRSSDSQAERKQSWQNVDRVKHTLNQLNVVFCLFFLIPLAWQGLERLYRWKETAHWVWSVSRFFFSLGSLRNRHFECMTWARSHGMNGRHFDVHTVRIIVKISGARDYPHNVLQLTFMWCLQLVFQSCLFSAGSLQRQATKTPCQFYILNLWFVHVHCFRTRMWRGIWLQTQLRLEGEDETSAIKKL